MYQVRDYRLRVCSSMAERKKVRELGFALACMFGCRQEDMKVFDSETGIEIPFAEFK